MEVVAGIGGLFFRARDPAALASWYQAHLGIATVPANPDDPVWEQQAGPTVFAPFAESTDYFGAAGNHEPSARALRAPVRPAKAIPSSRGRRSSLRTGNGAVAARQASMKIVAGCSRDSLSAWIMAAAS